MRTLAAVLKPIARLVLKCGLGWTEFTAVSKSVFVEVAAEEYGIRGRPTNVSRISAMTGLSRKEVRRIRSENYSERWTPNMESSPANTVIHYWHFDPEFCKSLGVPRPLPVEGTRSFTALVRRYVGDIPAGTMRRELLRAGTIVPDPSGRLIVRQRYFCPEQLHEDFIRNVGFSLSNLGNTVLFNATLAAQGESALGQDRERRFERCAWTERMSPRAMQLFREWIRLEAGRFVERTDSWIGENELPRSEWTNFEPHVVGVGVYYFEEQ